MIVWAIKNKGGQYLKILDIKYKDTYVVKWVDLKDAGFAESKEYCLMLINGYFPYELQHLARPVCIEIKEI